MSLRPITQAESDAWDAQPGTDCFGRPWSSWTRVIMTDHQAALIAEQARLMALEAEVAERRRQHRQARLVNQVSRDNTAAPSPQLEMFR